jgi:hypothetical protein
MKNNDKTKNRLTLFEKFALTLTVLPLFFLACLLLPHFCMIGPGLQDYSIALPGKYFFDRHSAALQSITSSENSSPGRQFVLNGHFEGLGWNDRVIACSITDGYLGLCYSSSAKINPGLGWRLIVIEKSELIGPLEKPEAIMKASAYGLDLERDLKNRETLARIGDYE